MTPLTTSLTVFAILVAGVLLGALLRRTLPDHHLDTNAKDAGNQADHRARPFLLGSRSNRELTQAFLFDRADLVVYET